MLLFSFHVTVMFDKSLTIHIPHGSELRELHRCSCTHRFLSAVCAVDVVHLSNEILTNRHTHEPYELEDFGSGWRFEKQVNQHDSLV